MTDLIKIGNVLNTNDYLKYIDEAKNLETVVHKYGTPFNIPDYPCWMQYLNEGKVIGSISFTRNTILNPILSEMIDKIEQVLIPIFPKNFPPDKKKIHFMKTNGSIVKHKDEAGRLSCINIGIKNSSTALTKISNDGVYNNFETNFTEIKVEEGAAYLLNTNQWHAVEGDLSIDRYLITYGFNKSFNEIKTMFKL